MQNTYETAIVPLLYSPYVQELFNIPGYYFQNEIGLIKIHMIFIKTRYPST